ncbi:metalloprotease PmbA [Utexia brackfieldae]|uniref:metalloprotease PmbA n=1 Tax=Utexia brackfieldae TaxID=3074108 RepID=UPI00370DC920
MKINKIKQDASAQKEKLSQAVQLALNESMKVAEAAEVAITQSTGIDVSTRLGNIENVEFNSDGALSIVVYSQHRKGSASTNALSPQAIKQAVKAALDIMQYTSVDPNSGIGDKALMAFNAPDLDLFYPSDLNVDNAVKLALDAEQAALAIPQITSSDGSSYSSSYGIHVYGNSHGMLESYCASRHSLSTCVIAEQDGQMERSYAYTTARDTRDLRLAQWVGEEAANKTIAHLGARQIETMNVPVLFSAEVATGLFSHLAGALSGGAIYRQSSFLVDALGRQIFPSWLNIVENPHILKGLGSAPFDSEGTRTKQQEIIRDGVVSTYLLGNYSARKLGLITTGHASGIHNWQISPNHGAFEDMLKLMDRGLLVTSLMGQGVNMITGDYSRGASGFWVKNGQIQYPVNEVTIAGNLSEMFNQIIAIGRDTEMRGRIQTGSVLIENMSIAGK